VGDLRPLRSGVAWACSRGLPRLTWRLRSCLSSEALAKEDPQPMSFPVPALWLLFNSCSFRVKRTHLRLNMGSLWALFCELTHLVFCVTSSCLDRCESATWLRFVKSTLVEAFPLPTEPLALLCQRTIAILPAPPRRVQQNYRFPIIELSGFVGRASPRRPLRAVSEL
jgi:hypothetical protein